MIWNLVADSAAGKRQTFGGTMTSGIAKVPGSLRELKPRESVRVRLRVIAPDQEFVTSKSEAALTVPVFAQVRIEREPCEWSEAILSSDSRTVVFRRGSTGPWGILPGLFPQP